MGFVLSIRSSLAECGASQGRASPAATQGAAQSLTALARFASGSATTADIALLRRAVKSYLDDSGKIALERYLRLPTTHTAWRKNQRDSYLCQAAELIDADGSWVGSQQLEAEWGTFVTRGPWHSWRDEDEPPSAATPLSAALFHATKLNLSKTLDAKQISRIAGHVFTAKSR